MRPEPPDPRVEATTRRPTIKPPGGAVPAEQAPGRLLPEPGHALGETGCFDQERVPPTLEEGERMRFRLALGASAITAALVVGAPAANAAIGNTYHDGQDAA